MRAGILGGGRAAGAFAQLLRAAGHELAGVALRRRSSGDLAERFALPVVSAAELASNCELLFFGVSDSAISEVAVEARRGGDPLAFHASGLLPSTILPFSRRFSLHPLRALPSTGEIDFRGTLLVFEGDSLARPLAEQLASASGASFAAIGAESKALYHSAAVIASNDVAALLTVAARLLQSGAIEESMQGDMRRSLAALAHSAIDLWSNNEGDARFTGPVARGDAAAVLLHLGALAGDEEALPLYRRLASVLLAALSPNEGRERIADLLRE